MRANNTNKMRQFSSLLNEHWKRKQRLKREAAKRMGQVTVATCCMVARTRSMSNRRTVLHGGGLRALRKTSMIDVSRAQKSSSSRPLLPGNEGRQIGGCSGGYFREKEHSKGIMVRMKGEFVHTPLSGSASLISISTWLDLITRLKPTPKKPKGRRRLTLSMLRMAFSLPLLLLLLLLLLPLLLLLLAPLGRVEGQSAALLQSDPRPTIYSGQVSFGLLLSAHSPQGNEIFPSASQQVRSLLALPPFGSNDFEGKTTIADHYVTAASIAKANFSDSPTTTLATIVRQTNETEPARGGQVEAGGQLATSDSSLEEVIELAGVIPAAGSKSNKWRHAHDKRQIFERTGQYRRQQQQEKLGQTGGGRSSSGESRSARGTCSEVNTNALYAGMGAIWASHQANLVGDSHLAIGTYVYDSCNDLDVGQRQSVRIVSNLNAFQQTTCESPRGSPISLTIAHGDNQLRAIQLLTSFRVPVITTKEHFALEDYSQLTSHQRKFLFTTAHSSRHLAHGALRFCKRILQRTTSSPKLPNMFHKSSSRNGLIVISRNLPTRFITYLDQVVGQYVAVETVFSDQPIDQIRSVEALESLMMKKNRGDSSSSTSSSSSSSSLSSSSASSSSPGASLASESRRSRIFAEPTKSPAAERLIKRDTDSDSSDGGDESGSSEAELGSKMLSPTILMFITPSEAIDLVTRLRNDMAEVSRYYSLIVATREDISPALKTIFQRGGSRLCSGKAFYTISPKPDDISEFSRYFRDTVQMEGESSDHPLVCEFAKHQSQTKSVSNDLDDISTEPVIKAVWSAAQAFKLVHKRECPNQSGTSSGGNTYRAGGSGTTSAGPSTGGGLSSSSSSASSSTSSSGGGSQTGDSDSPGEGRSLRQSGKSAHSDCMVKMNKNLSNLVQKQLDRLDATINSTGLQSLDGFRLKFDRENELMTNKFSIKYINKECEITEVGWFTGIRDSALLMEEDVFVQSIESILPDAWPVPATPAPTRPPPIPQVVTSAPSEQATSASADGSKESASSNADGSEASSGGDSSDSAPPVRPRKQHKVVASESNSDDSAKQSGGDDEDSPSANDSDKSSDRGELESAPKRTSKRSRLGELSATGGGGGGGGGRHFEDRRGLSRRKLDQAASRRRKQQLMASPVTAMGGRGILPGVTDTDIGDEPEGTESSSNRAPSPHSGSNSGAQTLKVTSEERNPTTTPTASTSGGLMSDSSSAQPKQLRRVKPFATLAGATFKDWLPSGLPFPSLANTYRPVESAMIARNPDHRFLSAHPVPVSLHESEQVSNSSPNSDSSDLKSRATTQAPVFSTLPESGGNADLDQPPTRSHARTTPSARAANSRLNQTLDTAATTESSDYVTLSSISKNVYDNQPPPGQLAASTQQQNMQPDYHYEPASAAQQVRANQSSSTTSHPQVMQHTASFDMDAPRSNGYLKDLNSSPIPLISTTASIRASQVTDNLRLSDAVQDKHSASTAESKEGRSALRSHLGLIYSGWFGIIILGANIVGALLTLYVLTFLLMKNCDGSLDRENQGIRSMHLLAIIVVFFGSTLFIVYPTPGLCLLRSSWHNFALVMLFGTLLLQAMQTRSLNSLGLGGRPNRLNQFLTLLFIIGVQVSFELQRWKYESANYVNFVNQYFGGSSETSQKLLSLSNAVANQFNPLNSFNDQITPVSIQVSEQYQNLLHDYCRQQADDFFQSQFYLCSIVTILVIFSFSSRNSRRLTGGGGGGGGGVSSSVASAHHKLASALTTSGKLVASQHETNLTNLSSSHFQFASNNLDTGNLFMVTLIAAPIYFISILLHLYGQNSANRDLISSVTMILIAFAALIGIFLPILLQIHRYDNLVADRLPGTLTRPVITQSRLQDGSSNSSAASNAFAMFPEFAPTGLRRPSSTSGDSSSGAGSRRPFADTKESRRNMGAALANLGPSADSLRSMGFYEHERNLINANEPIDPALLNLKLNLSANQDQSSTMEDLHFNNQQHNHHRQTASAKRPAKGEKRLIMLDVDPCCPRHGVAAAAASTRPGRPADHSAPRSGKPRNSHCH